MWKVTSGRPRGRKWLTRYWTASGLPPPLRLQVDDHRVAAGQEAHRSLQRRGAFRADPHEAVIGHVADVAGQDAQLGDAVIGGAGLALVAAFVGLALRGARRRGPPPACGS